jgi:hypothetical protein
MPNTSLLRHGGQYNREVAMHRSRRTRTVARWVALGALLLGVSAGLARAAAADPGPQEQRKIESEALESFRRIMTLWREEVYFELYDQGTAASKARITREEFAQRMVQLEWLPAGEINPRFLKPEYRFRTMVYVQARIPYKNKFNTGDPFAKDQSVLLLLEDGQWKIDLVQLIRSPYVD